MFIEKLNRSQSESDIYVSQFDNLSLRSPRNLKHIQSSCSSIVRRVYVEEIYSPSRNQLENTRYIKTDDMSYSTDYRQKYYAKFEDNQEVDEEPMEVDGSFVDERFPKMMGTSILTSVPRLRKPDNVTLDDDIHTDIKQIKPLPEQRTITIVTGKHSTNKSLIVLLFLILLIILLSVYYLKFHYIVVNSDIQIEHIKQDLVTNVHGHKHLINKFINILETRSNWSDKLKVISFIGSQGVGKTFFAGLIKKNFPQHLSHDIYGTHLYYDVNKQNILNSVNSYCLNLVVVDDLKHKDYVEIFSFAHSFPKNVFILLIAIFNTHYTNDDLNTVVKYEDVIKIRDSFDSSGIKNYDMFVFEDFTYDQIKDWMKKELSLKNISSAVSDEISQNILETHNIKYGLKGLHSKMLLELEKCRT